MEYNKLISVIGLSGLYELISTKKDGAIVRSLEDKSTKFVASRSHNFSHLETIEVFTEGDNVNLSEVFEAMKKSNEHLPDEKDSSAIKKYFQKVYPTLDFERVHASDMKKMIKWFKILQENNVDFSSKENQETVNEEPLAEERPKEDAVK